MRGMVIDMNDEQLSTLAQLRAFVEVTVTLDFAVAADERYEFIARTVKRSAIEDALEGYNGLITADNWPVIGRAVLLNKGLIRPSC